MTSEYDYLFKILLIGDSGVDKSALLLRFADDTYSESYISTIGVDFKIRSVELDGKVCKLQLHNTAGQERFRTITSSYCRGAHGIVLAYDITDLETYNSIERWFVEIERLALPGVKLMLVGTNCDRESRRVVTFEMGCDLANHHGCPFFETSARTNSNVEEAFLGLASSILTELQAPSRHRLHRVKFTWVACRHFASLCGPRDVRPCDSLVQHILSLPEHVFEKIIEMLHVTMFPNTMPCRPTRAIANTTIGNAHEGQVCRCSMQ